MHLDECCPSNLPTFLPTALNITISQNILEFLFPNSPQRVLKPLKKMCLLEMLLFTITDGF